MSPSSATDSATQTPSSIDPPAAAMPDFKIIPATSSDVPTLAEIIRASYLEEAAFRFAFPGQPKPEDVRHMFQVRLEGRVVSGDALLFKAADDSGKTLGFICFSHENAPKPAGEQAPKSDMQEKALKMSTMSMNMKFVMAMGMVAKELAAHCEGVEHWYVSSFAVHPDHQGKGIGTELLRHCMQIADEHRLPSWLQALPGSHSLYLRAGFVDVVHRDVDLNEWDGFKYRGHGLYRTYMMERQSRSVESGAP